MQFTFGVPDYDIFNLDGGNGGGEDNEENKFSHVSLLEQLDSNQTASTQSSAEDSNAEMNNVGGGGGSKSNSKSASGYQFSAGASNNYYELILHKIMHYNVRKYPDEIITRNVILKGICNFVLIFTMFPKFL